MREGERKKFKSGDFVSCKDKARIQFLQKIKQTHDNRFEVYESLFSYGKEYVAFLGYGGVYYYNAKYFELAKQKPKYLRYLR